jgi:hypothetical protein
LQYVDVVKLTPLTIDNNFIILCPCILYHIMELQIHIGMLLKDYFYKIF